VGVATRGRLHGGARNDGVRAEGYEDLAVRGCLHYRCLHDDEVGDG
jgi:hypothetical protein